MNCLTKKVGWTVIERRLDGVWHKESRIDSIILDELFYKEGWMGCCTKKDGWTVIQRRLGGLLYKEKEIVCFKKKVGWAFLQRMCDEPT